MKREAPVLRLGGLGKDMVSWEPTVVHSVRHDQGWDHTVLEFCKETWCCVLQGNRLLF